MTDPTSPIELLMVALVACMAGFTTGLAGFGTGLVAAGIWLYLIPSGFVPPLVAIVSVAAQLTSLSYIRRHINWPVLAPYLIGAAVGIPLGVLVQRYASSSVLRISIGVFLVGFTLFEFVVKERFKIRSPGANVADPVVGAGGGFLGGFAGLSGPLPVIWLRLRGGTPTEQRAIYQPFNLLVLSGATLTMGFQGQIQRPVIIMAWWCIPAAIIGARIGTLCYARVNRTIFRRIVLSLLLASGLSLVAL